MHQTSSISLEDIAARAAGIKAELSRRAHTATLLAFTQYTKSDYEVNWHHKVVADALDDVLRGSCRRLLVMMPPQNGKSELVSRRFPAYALGKRPELRLAAASYNADLAMDMSRDVQLIMDTPAYKQLFPHTRLSEGRDDDVKTTKQFTVVGHRGRYYATGVGGGLSGRTVDIGIIDDPIKNREEAERSATRGA